MISFNFHFAVLVSPPVVLPSGRADRNHAGWIEGALDGKRQAAQQKSRMELWPIVRNQSWAITSLGFSIISWFRHNNVMLSNPMACCICPASSRSV